MSENKQHKDILGKKEEMVIKPKQDPFKMILSVAIGFLFLSVLGAGVLLFFPDATNSGIDKKLKDLIIQMDSQVQAMDNKIRSLEKQNATNAESDQVQAEISSLLVRVDEVETNLVKQLGTRKNNTSNADLSRTRKSVSDLEAKVQSMQRENNRLQQMVQASNAELRKVNNKFDKTEKQNQNLDKQIKNLSQRGRGEGNNSQVDTGLLSDMQSELAGVKTQAGSATKLANSFTSNIRKLERQIKELGDKNDNRNRNNGNSEQLKVVQRDVQQLSAEVSNINNAVGSLTEDLRKMNDVLASTFKEEVQEGIEAAQPQLLETWDIAGTGYARLQFAGNQIQTLKVGQAYQDWTLISAEPLDQTVIVRSQKFDRDITLQSAY